MNKKVILSIFVFLTAIILITLQIRGSKPASQAPLPPIAAQATLQVNGRQKSPQTLSQTQVKPSFLFTATQNSPPRDFLFAVPKIVSGKKIDPKNPYSHTGLDAKPNGHPKGRIGLIPWDFLPNLANFKRDDQVIFPLFDTVVAAGKVNLVQPQEDGLILMGGELSAPKKGSFSIGGSEGKLGGMIFFENEPVAYEVTTKETGEVIIEEKLISELMCVEVDRHGKLSHFPTAGKATSANLDLAATTTSNQLEVATTAITVPILNSLTSQKDAVLYLDFDGETVEDPAWNGGGKIIAAAYDFDKYDLAKGDPRGTYITKVWGIVSEDFAPFNINVTTDENRYYNAPAGHRMRCIITPTNTVAPGTGGAAWKYTFRRKTADDFLASFSSTIPCWVFNSGKLTMARSISHELGHTLGLSHDGRIPQAIGGYYEGHGDDSTSTSWGPIMGAAYSKSVVQWSKGEYYDANNTEDDLAIIASTSKISNVLGINVNNGFGYKPDDNGNTRETAKFLPVNQSLFPKLIERNTDIDYFRIDIAAGKYSVVINADIISASPNLDVEIQLEDSSGKALVTANPPDSLSAKISTTLSQGTYYLRVRGVNAGNPLVSPPTGYTNYGSIGSYALSASVTQSVPAAPTNLSAMAVSSSQVNITWSESDSTVAKFGIERKIGTGGTWSVIAYPSGSARSYQNTGLSANTTYYYRLRAFNSANQASGYSNTTNAVTSSTGSSVTKNIAFNSANPSVGVYIYISPSSTTGTSDGVTPFGRAYYSGTQVTATAPPLLDGNSFQKWQRDGVDFSNSTQCTVTMDANHTMTAVYGSTTRVLNGLFLSGPDPSVDENTSYAFTATARFTDGSTMLVMPIWSTSNSAVATISNAGVLNVSSVDADTTFDVIAKYTYGSIVVTTTRTLSVINSNKSSTYSLTVISDHGQIIKTPSDSNYSAGTQVRISALSEDGYLFSGWSGDASGTTSPITITMDSNKQIYANYTLIPNGGQSGVTVTILPQSAIAAGARWRYDGGDLQNSGDTVTTKFAGDHTITATSIPGFDAPAPVIISLAPGEIRAMSINYISNAVAGSLQASLTPQAAVDAGAQWQVDGGAWQANGSTVYGLSEGNHTIKYKALAGWIEPVAATVSVVNGQRSFANGAYAPAPGVPAIFSIAPSMGALGGGTLVNIVGANFGGAPKLTFNGLPASSVTLIDSTHLTAKTPASASYGTVAVSLQTGGGTATLANGFTYDTPLGNGMEMFGHAGGVTFGVAVDGTHAYISQGSLFVVMDISNPANPIPVGQLPLPDLIYDIVLEGNYAYVADNLAGLRIVDVSNPSAPLLKGFYKTSGPSRGIEVLGGFAYLANLEGGLQILNVVNPTAPTLAGSYSPGGYVNDVSIQIFNGTVMAYLGYKDGCAIVDVGDPASPVEQSKINLGIEGYRTAVDGNKFYVTKGWQGWNGFAFVDVTDPKNPIETSIPVLALTKGIYAKEGLLYTLGGSYLYVVTITNQNGIQWLRGVSLRDDTDGHIAIQGNYAYVSAGENGFHIVDISDNGTGEIPILGYYQSSSTMVNCVQKTGTNLLVGTNNGVEIFDISDPSKLIFKSSLALPYLVDKLKILGNTAYSRGDIIDISNPAAPIALSRLSQLYSMDVGFLEQKLLVVGSNMDYAPSIFVINTNNLMAPFIESTFLLGSNGTSPANALAINSISKLVYVALPQKDGTSIVKTADLTTLSAPKIRGIFQPPSFVNDLVLSVDNKYLLIANSLDGLIILDVSNPDNLIQVGIFKTTGPGITKNLTVSGNQVFLTGSYGLKVIDITDPTNPVLARSYDTNYDTAGVVVSGDYVYWAQKNTGLSVLRLNDLAKPSVTITNPTTSPTYTATTGTISLGGAASDNNKVAGVFWSNNRGGGGNATGGNSWVASNVNLFSGQNVITVTAVDPTGNSGTDTITVNYSPADNTPPTVRILTPTTSATFATSSETISLSGSATDDTSLAEVTWSNNHGSSGVAALSSTSWNVSNIAIQEGDNIINVTAKDSSGNTASSNLKVSRMPADIIPPTISIQTPTINQSFTTNTSSISLAGIASDNVALKQVIWSSDRAGNGYANGANTWDILNVPLQFGANVITVTSEDIAGNLQIDSINIIYAPPVQLNLISDPSEGGTLTGSGTFVPGSTSQISVNTNSGWIFTGWNDGVLLTTRTIVVPDTNVTYIANFIPTWSFKNWGNTYFTASQLNDPNVSGWNSDPDSDGLSNGWEFFFNFNPSKSMSPSERKAMPKGAIQTIGESSYFTFTYQRRLLGWIGGPIKVSISDDLITWDDTEGQLEYVGTPIPTADGVTETVTIRVKAPINGSKFIRLIETAFE